MQWVGLIALPTLFTVMFAIGLMLGPAQVAAAMTRRTILLAVLFAAVVPLPVVTIVAVELFHLRGPLQSACCSWPSRPARHLLCARPSTRAHTATLRRRCTLPSSRWPW